MMGIRGGATFIEVLLVVSDTVLKRESKIFAVLLLFDGGDPVGGRLEPPTVHVELRKLGTLI